MNLHKIITVIKITASAEQCTRHFASELEPISLGAGACGYGRFQNTHLQQLAPSDRCHKAPMG